MKILFILNEGPYGNERSYNGLRLAIFLAKQDSEEVRIFLIGDGSLCAKKDQKVPQGYYNTEIMLNKILHNRGEIGVCSTCMDARGLSDKELVEGTKRSTMDELTIWTIWADKVIVF